MDFINSSGRIFSIETETSNIGWEHSDGEYCMWCDSPIAGPNIPIGTWNVMQIVPYIGIGNTIGENMSNISLDNIIRINVLCKSSIFKVCGYSGTGELSHLEFDMGDESLSSYETTVSYDRNSFIISEEEILAPFFCICKSDEEGTMMTNLLIEVVYSEERSQQASQSTKTSSAYTVLRVGGQFVDVSEKMEINCGNFGISLPKEILSAVYQSPVVEKSTDFDASLYNEKLREYLMERMCLKGEEGSYNGLSSALAWFGWGDRLKISNLMRTDNKMLTQYLRSSFDIRDVSVNAFLRFRNTALVSFKLKENDILYKELNESDEQAVVKPQDWEADMNGEGLPETEDLFKKFVVSEISDSKIEYYEPYYMYDIYTISLKLSFFKYYYKKYFCPVHADVLTASVEHRDFMQDIKITQLHSFGTAQKPVLCGGECIVDIFGKSSYDLCDYSMNKVRFESEQHFVDRNFCEFSIYKEKECYDNISDTSEFDVYETHEMCITIPLRFWSCMSEKINYESTGLINSSYIYNTNIIVSKWSNIENGWVIVQECRTSFVQSDTNRLENLIIIPHLNAKFKNEGLYWWLSGSYRIDINCNGRWFSQCFSIKTPEITAEIGYLEYKYSNAMSSIYSLKENPYAGRVMWEPTLVSVTNTKYINDIEKWNKSEYKQEKDGIVSKYADTYQLPDYENAPEYYNIIFKVDLIDSSGKLINNTHPKYKVLYSSLYSSGMINVTSVNIVNNIINQISTKYHKSPLKEFTASTLSNLNLKFDCYMMKDAEYTLTHDDEKYYFSFVSMFTINHLISFFKEYFELVVSPNEIITTLNDILNDTTKNSLYSILKPYISTDSLTKYASKSLTTRFLINRMQIVKVDGTNAAIPQGKIISLSLYKRNQNQYCNNPISKYDTGIIVGQNAFMLESFNLPFKMDVVSAKWRFIPYSLNIKNERTVTSKANSAIMGMQSTATDYVAGYYNVEIDYSLDGKTIQTYKLPYKVRILR